MNHNHKRGFLAFIVAFVFMFLFGFFWHGMLMKPMYEATASLWRPEADFNAHFPILILGHAVVAFAFTGLYVSQIGKNCAGVGFGYGIVIGILSCGVEIIRFAVEPLTTNILWMWFAADLICFAIMGALVSAIYKPLTSTT
jgi:hypothetical protein